CRVADFNPLDGEFPELLSVNVRRIVSAQFAHLLQVRISGVYAEGTTRDIEIETGPGRTCIHYGPDALSIQCHWKRDVVCRIEDERHDCCRRSRPIDYFSVTVILRNQI